MSEISELTKKIDNFIQDFSTTVGGHVESIQTCKDERSSLFKKLEGKNGLTSRVQSIETREKVRTGYFSGILGIIGLIVSIITIVILMFSYNAKTSDRYRGVDAKRDLGLMEERLNNLESRTSRGGVR